MSDRMRWRYGDTNPVVAAVAAATVIEIGDLVWQDVDNVKPASGLANQGGKTANQQAFVQEFLGVAMQRSRLGDTAPLRVATTGVFEMDCAGDTFELGGAAHYAVGRAARRAASATASVLVDIRSSVMTGGVLGGSSSGA